ncbi:MAG: hypothetical protein KC653_01050, partial [Candidatus Andersenbacteria bacterium]|nr:hypothetical protein [Candidatus Andersenbacteria bacterium]
MQRTSYTQTQQAGAVMVVALIFVTIVVFIWLALVGLIVTEHQVATRKHLREQSLEIAEAGIDYYRWHLAHDADDYQDGTGLPGPYIHPFLNANNEQIGEFELEIIPPPIGSTIVEVVSTGRTNTTPSVERTIRARVGRQSLASFGFLTNSNVWFGDTENTVGTVHANGGIRFDGVADSLVLTPKDTYICGPEHGCNNEEMPGIWGDGSPTELWQFPPDEQVAAVDFETVTIDLSQIQTDAQADGIALGECNGQCYGYHVEFHADGTLSIYRVRRVWSTNGFDVEGQPGDSQIDIREEQLHGGFTNVPIPDNGLIFLEDKTWVSGTVNGRATVAAATFPAGVDDKSIIIHDDIQYLARNGEHSLGLIAQQDVLIPRYAPADLVIDAAMMAQNGSTQRYYYQGNVLNSIETYGSTISNGVWTWGWVCEGGATCSGYTTTDTIY